MCLLDTNVVGELRRPRPHPGVAAWLQQATGAPLFIAAVTVAEIRIAIERTRRTDQDKADELEAWLGRVRATHKIVPMDDRIADIWGRMQESSLKNVDPHDLLIAASAVADSLVLVTRNLRHFLPIHGHFPLRGLIDPLRFDGCGGEVVIPDRGA